MNPFEAEGWKRRPLVGLFIRAYLIRFGQFYPYFLFRVWRRIKAVKECKPVNYDQFRVVVCRLKKMGLIEPQRSVGVQTYYGRPTGRSLSRNPSVQSAERAGRDMMDDLYHFGWVNTQIAFGKRFAWGEKGREEVGVGNTFLEEKRTKWHDMITDQIRARELRHATDKKAERHYKEKLKEFEKASTALAQRLYNRFHRGEADVSMPKRSKQDRKNK